jgi:uncharacterized protein
MRQLTLRVSDFLKTDTIEVKDYKYNSGDVGVKTDILVSFRALKSSQESIYINGIIRGFIDLECSRCLDLYKHQIEIPISADIEAVNEQVDVAEEVRQLLLLNMPVKPICNKGCLGICQICGKNKKNNNSCNCVDNVGELVEERWKELLNNKRRK